MGDLQTFATFLELCAGRTAGLLNLSSLAGDCGINHNTARAWLSVLETSYIAFRLPAWRTKAKRRLTKAPKLHFFDTGLACSLLGIHSPDQLRHHPLRGALFESWVVSEVYKRRVHAGLMPQLYFFRDQRGLELDLLVDLAQELICVEVKSGATIGSDYFKAFDRFERAFGAHLAPKHLSSRVVYGGKERQTRQGTLVSPWEQINGLSWREPSFDAT